MLPVENIYGHTKKLTYLLGRVAEAARHKSGTLRVLDFGCGNGVAVSQYLIAQGVEYYGVDIHAPSLEHARSQFGGPLTWFGTEVPPGLVFDVIVYSDVLEHLDAPSDLVQEHVRQLSESGIVIGAVPNGFGPFELEKKLDSWFKVSRAVSALVRLNHAVAGTRPTQNADVLPYNFDSGHLQFFSRRRLIAMLEACGLRVTDLQNGSFVGAPLSEQVLLRGERIARLNVAVADKLPWWMVSTWYFTAVPAVTAEQ